MTNNLIWRGSDISSEILKIVTDKLKVCRQIPLLKWLDLYFFLTVLEVESVPLSRQMFQFKRDDIIVKAQVLPIRRTQGSINCDILASGIRGSENKKYLVFAEILFAEHTLLEEIILNKVSLRGSPAIILPWSYMGWHRRCHKITNAHTSASQTVTKEQKCCLTYVSKCKSILCHAYDCFFTLFY